MPQFQSNSQIDLAHGASGPKEELAPTVEGHHEGAGPQARVKFCGSLQVYERGGRRGPGHQRASHYAEQEVDEDRPSTSSPVLSRQDQEISVDDDTREDTRGKVG